MARIARRVVVSGRVTGIGFRYATLCEARQYAGLAGFVRNVDRNTVECFLQGEEAAVEALAAWLRQGPPGARVLQHTVSAAAWREDCVDFDVVG